LKRRLRLNHNKSKNQTELFNILKEEWFKTKPESINKLIDNMPRRVDAVLKSIKILNFLNNKYTLPGQKYRDTCRSSKIIDKT